MGVQFLLIQITNMISQQQQQTQPSQVITSQVQLRQSLALKQLDSTSQHLINAANQPLSPTQSSFSGQAKTTANDQKNGQLGKQRELKGAPQLVGLTSVEYEVSEELKFSVGEITRENIAENYCKVKAKNIVDILHEESNDEILQFKGSDLSAVNEQYLKCEIQLSLPVTMTIEHVELSLNQRFIEVFKKYLKFFLCTGENQCEMVIIKGGFIDFEKRVIEVLSCGVSKVLKLQFLYSFKKKPTERKIQEMEDLRKEQMFSKTQNVSEKIKNEILPLLDKAEEDIDDLDDEVAMISNKKSATSKNMKLKDLISVDDIMVEIKEEKLSKNQSKKAEEETRNFNTLPRNYSDPKNQEIAANESSYNDVDFSSNMIDQQLLSKEVFSLHDSVGVNLSQPKEDLQIIEAEIFGKASSKKEDSFKLIQKCISSIKITGFNCNMIHAITNLTHFINQSNLLKQRQRMKEAQEYDFMSGILMISTKRYTQAMEIFRKIQLQLLKQIENQPSQDLFEKCAILEMLIAESMCQPNQLTEKLQSLQRMDVLISGKTVKLITFNPQTQATEDPFSIMIKIIPNILKFTIRNLLNQKEIVKMAALKLVSFILETQGCSLDNSMVYILKALLTTYPLLKETSNFTQKELSQSVNEFFQIPKQNCDFQSEDQKFYKNLKEPSSGFFNALRNAYNQCLDIYMSVLSSISSHILHQLFYEIIMPTLTNQESPSSIDTKVFSVKIAEKIITICQGDLILKKQDLDFFLLNTINKVGQIPKEQETLNLNIKNLWQSIRSKVFTNYSQKGLRTLIEWLVEKMTQIAQNAQNSSHQGTLSNNEQNQDISKLEVSDEENQQLLQIFDIVSMVSVGRKQNEVEANSLIKIKQDYCFELYLLINPLLFWLDFSVEREERFPLFKQVYSTIKDVLENLPPKRVDIDLLQIMIPILQRTTEFLKNNSPSLQMLKFLDIVLRDLKQGEHTKNNVDLQYFFLELLNNFVNYISYCLYEEVFSVFDKLLSLCCDVINEKVVTKCIESLVDKYTIKSKAHKNSLQIFMKALMEVKIKQRGKDGISNRTITNTDEDIDDEQISVQSKNNYFDILCEFCFFNNKDPFDQEQSQASKIREDFKSQLDVHDLYIDKLQFFLESLGLLTEMHVSLFISLITHPKFKPTLFQLLNKGETSLRLKAHELLEVIANYYVQQCTSKTVYKMQSQTDPKKIQEQMEVEFINHERLYLSQIVLHVALRSLEQKEDAYLQFNSLIILDFLFQNLLPVPTYQNEMQRERINKSNPQTNVRKDVIDLNSLEIREDTPEFEVTSSQYLYMRLDLVLKLWPWVQQALNSPWSNIRSICYGLICSMLKVDLQFLLNQKSENPNGQHFVNSLKEIVIPMLESLLSSKESESKAGGLNILGSFCGLSYDFSKVKISKNLEFFRKNSSSISQKIWQLVFDLQDDWDITIKEASVVLIQLCAPRDAVKNFDKIKRDREDKRFTQMLQGYGLGQGGLNSFGDQSSRLGSERGRNNKYALFSQSISSSQIDDLNDLINPLQPTKNQIKAQDITSLFSNNDHEDLKDALQQDLNKQMYLSGSQIFDHIGNTISSAKFNDRIDKFDLDDPQKKIIQNLLNEEKFDFFVDIYSDEQIQEIISIFRNDFKPPKNLWIEKNQNSGFNGPDFYAEIFSQAIDQFNQQQLQLQQQQQQQQALMVSGSNKNKSISHPVSIVDAIEDDLVKRYENEKNEKEKAKLNQIQSQAKQNEQDGTYKIFERHYEESELIKQDAKESVQINAKVQLVQEEKMAEQPSKKAKNKGEKKKKTQPSTQLQLQILDESEQKQFKPKVQSNENITDDKLIPKQTRKNKTTDELIEEYERKISITKQLLEEEKKKKKQPIVQTQHETIEKPNQEPIAKSTPDFKQKKESQKTEREEPLQKSQEKISKKQFNETQPTRSLISNIDNARLIKQINNCFNDNSFNNFNIGPVVMTANIQASTGTKHKQKLNKSFENVLAAKQHNLRHSNEGGKVASKKNLSTSPRRGSSSSKKYGSSKSGGNAKRKYLDQSYQKAGERKVLYNMRDLNYFIKTIEKDLSEKFNKYKDFNSMPTTPTSILKKVEEQMKAISTQNAFSKADIKQQMSNTCPNIAQVLSQIDQPPNAKPQSKQPVVLSQLNMNVPSQKTNSQAYSDPYHSSQHTPSNVSNINSNLFMAQSQNTLSNYSIGNQQDKFTFSKTQKIDLKDTNKSLIKYQVEAADGRTARDNSNDLVKKQQDQDVKQKNSKVQKKATSKRSRGSQDKYLTQNNVALMLNNQSSSSSQTKLNKSLNNISSISGSNVSFNPKKKDLLSKSMIQSLAKTNNLSPSNKKLIQQMIKQQLGQNQGHSHLYIQQTPICSNHNQNQYSYSSNILYDYIQNSDQTRKSSFYNNSKTPVKQQGIKNQFGKTTNFTEILEVSPSSGEKEYRKQPRIIS